MSHSHPRPSTSTPAAYHLSPALVPSPSVVASPSPPPIPDIGQSSVSSAGIVKTTDPQLVINPNLSPAHRRPSPPTALLTSVDHHPGSYTSLPVLDGFPAPMSSDDQLYEEGGIVSGGGSGGAGSSEGGGGVGGGVGEKRGGGGGGAGVSGEKGSRVQSGAGGGGRAMSSHASGTGSSPTTPLKPSSLASFTCNVPPAQPTSSANSPHPPESITLHSYAMPTSSQSSQSLLSPSSSLHRSSSLLHLRGTNKKLVLGMVGLPARGKTYIAQKVSRYLNWSSYLCQVFNIGVYRRRMFGAHLPADWFDPINSEGVRQRNECALAALDDMFHFFQQGGQAAVFDGTNTTAERREMVRERVERQASEMGMVIELVWIESIVHDEKIVEENIRETKLTSPDYDHVTADSATADFKERIKNYNIGYETLPSSTDQPYVKLIDAGRQIVTNRIVGYLMSKIVLYLHCISPRSHGGSVTRAPIYISRHGESQHNVLGLIGGDSDLSPQGLRYAKALAKFIEEENEFKGDNAKDLTVWTSTMRRTIQTATYFHLPITQWRALIEIQVGTCFPEHDTRILTDAGMQFLSEIEARVEDGETVLYACYDKETMAVCYSTGTLVFPRIPAGLEMIEFTPTAESQHWAEGSGPYGEAWQFDEDEEEQHEEQQEQGQEQQQTEKETEKETTKKRKRKRRTPYSNHVSLRVTADHKLLVQLGNESVTGRVAWSKEPHKKNEKKLVDKPPSVVAASELLSPCQCPPDDFCLHRRACVRMVACAEAGHAVAKAEGEGTTERAKVQLRLGLNDKQFFVFLGLLGFWLGDGSMEYRRRVAGVGGGYNAVSFGNKKKSDRDWLRGALRDVGLAEDAIRTTFKPSSEIEVFLILDQRWFSWFDDEFGYKYKRTSRSLQPEHSPASRSLAARSSATTTSALLALLQRRAEQPSSEFSTAGTEQSASSPTTSSRKRVAKAVSSHTNAGQDDAVEVKPEVKPEEFVQPTPPAPSTPPHSDAAPVALALSPADILRFQRVAQLAGEEEAARVEGTGSRPHDVMDPFIYSSPAPGQYAAAVTGVGSSIVLQLHGPLSFQSSKDTDGLRPRTIQVLEALAATAHFDFNGVVLSELVPIVWEDCFVQEVELLLRERSSGYSDVSRASCRAALRTPACVFVLFGEHSAEAYREVLKPRTGAVVAINEDVRYYTARRDRRDIAVVECPHPGTRHARPAVTMALRAAGLLRLSMPAVDAAALAALVDTMEVDEDAGGDEEQEPPASDGDPDEMTKSAKWFPYWVTMQLSPVELQQLVAGLWHADGCWKVRLKRIFTSSVAFRDQLIQVLLHCGFSAHHRLFFPRGTLRGYSFLSMTFSAEYVQSLKKDQGWTPDMMAAFEPITATVDAWAVEWAVPAASSGMGACFPHMRRQQSIQRMPYSSTRDGRIWCVKVDHDDHLIFAQRAERHNGVVTKQSKPVVVSNCDNLSYEEIADKYPAEADARKKDKLRYRYPQGESYLDVIQRLEPCILELERMQSPVLLIVHRAVARCLLSYFMDIDPNQIPHLEVPLHTVLKLQPKAYQCQVTTFQFPIPSVDLPTLKGT